MIVDKITELIKLNEESASQFDIVEIQLGFEPMQVLKKELIENGVNGSNITVPLKIFGVKITEHPSFDAFVYKLSLRYAKEAMDRNRLS